MLAKNTLAVCNTVAVLAIILVTAIFIPTFNMSFYRAEYAKYGIPQRIGVEESKLMAVTVRLTDYMRGRADDLVIVVDVNGESREFFNDREKAHMVDVKVLFTIARIAFVAAAFVVAITSFLLRKDLSLMSRTGLRVLGVITAIIIILTIIIALDFDSAFTTFHHIFFNNDLWILNPATDLLVNIVPQEFFVDISSRVGMIFGGLTLGYICLLACLRRYTRG